MIPMQKMAKLISIVNSFLMGFVVLMLGFYAYYGVTYMVYHSIPTIASYVVFYQIIRRNKLHIYVWLLYAAITIYMVAATICLGYNSGFHLYCLSLVSVTFYIAMIDIDDFKKINDEYGHSCGDFVLVDLCKTMRNLCVDCVISRWGGEEFLLTAHTDREIPDPALLERFREAVE